MKLLIDNQLPLALAAHLRGWGLDAVHVLETGQNTADDAEIWARAAVDGRVVVSKDDDFLVLATHSGASRPADLGPAGQLPQPCTSGGV